MIDPSENSSAALRLRIRFSINDLLGCHSYKAMVAAIRQVLREIRHGMCRRT